MDGLTKLEGNWGVAGLGGRESFGLQGRGFRLWTGVLVQEGSASVVGFRV